MANMLIFTTFVLLCLTITISECQIRQFLRTFHDPEPTAEPTAGGGGGGGGGSLSTDSFLDMEAFKLPRSQIEDFRKNFFRQSIPIAARPPTVQNQFEQIYQNVNFPSGIQQKPKIFMEVDSVNLTITCYGNVFTVPKDEIYSTSCCNFQAYNLKNAKCIQGTVIKLDIRGDRNARMAATIEPALAVVKKLSAQQLEDDMGNRLVPIDSEIVEDTKLTNPHLIVNGKAVYKFRCGLRNWRTILHPANLVCCMDKLVRTSESRDLARCKILTQPSFMTFEPGFSSK